MKTKIIFIIILISLINIILSSSEENNYDESFEKKDYSREANPYLVFGVPPWTKYKDVKKRFKKITEKMKQKNMLNSIQYQRYKIAFEQIEQDYRKNNDKDKSFFDVVKITIKNIFFYEFIIFTVLCISWAIYKFNTFAALLVATFISVDSIIPHWFSTFFWQAIFSFILTLIIYFRDYFFKGKNNNGNNENTNNNNTGKRTRKRFEKIE